MHLEKTQFHVAARNHLEYKAINTFKHVGEISGFISFKNRL